MRHRVRGRKLGRKTQHRRAMWRNMAASLFTHGQITTTLPKAKSVQPFVEKLITTAKRGDLHARRQVIQQMGDPIMIRHDEDEDVERNRYGELVGGPRVVKHLFDNIAPRYADRDGGYTRIIKLAKHRIGDGSDLCVIQLVGEQEYRPKPGTSSRRRQQADKRMAFAAQLRRGGEKAPPPGEQAPEQPEDLGEPSEEGRAESEHSTDQHKQSIEDAEPREGDTAEGDDRQSS